MQVTGYVHIPAVHRQRAWSLMPVTLLYVGNVAFALMSLQNLNIPMYNTLKRMTPVIVLVTKASLAGHSSQCSIRGVQGHAQNAALSMALPQKLDSCCPLKSDEFLCILQILICRLFSKSQWARQSGRKTVLL